MIRVLKLTLTYARALLIVIALVTTPIVGVMLYILGLRFFPEVVLAVTVLVVWVLLEKFAPDARSGYGGGAVGDGGDGGDVDFDF